MKDFARRLLAVFIVILVYPRLFATELFSAPIEYEIVPYGAEVVEAQPVQDDLGILPTPELRIAPLFTPSVQWWNGALQVWGAQYGLDPNLLATIMQIESCGHPEIGSPAGAQGLFQVMPFHFASSENMHDPDTNAYRAAVYLNYLFDQTNDVDLVFAAYNGGPRRIWQSWSQWGDETRRYHYWATGIYPDARANRDSSDRLDEWYARASEMCDGAEARLGI